MHSILWRNKAIALLAGLIFALALLSGLPQMVENIIFALLSLVIVFLAMAPTSRVSSVEKPKEDNKEESAQSLIDRYFS